MAKGMPKRQPQRTCIACRRTSTKRDLIRLVRTPSGEIVLDAPSKLPGRGAYLCRNKSCWLVALAQKRIGPALKMTLTDEDYARIASYASQLPDVDQEA